MVTPNPVTMIIAGLGLLSGTVSPGRATDSTGVSGFARFARGLGVLLLIMMLAGVLAGRSLAGLSAPREAEVAGRVALVADPEWVAGAIRVDVRLNGRRYEAWARGSPAYVLESMLSGETVEVAAEIRPFDDEWLPRRARHVVGMLDVDVAWNTHRATGLAGLANSLRRSIVAGSQSLSQRDRVLLSGFSVGDDRQQLPEVTDDFRAAGLTHLTAVSGQNVAFVLLIFGPLLRRLGPRGRVLVTMAVLIQFGLITRWEPSVMRAIALAVAASIGQLFEGTASGIRMLGFVVTVLIVVDPMLVHSLGFILSVMASVGIALFLAPLGRRLPGPRWIAEPLALTLSAQLGVILILIATFGSVPLVSVPANLAAGPAAGPLMAWGLTVGPLAGQLPHGIAAVLHVPTRLLTGYVAIVARVSSAVDGPEVGLTTLALLTGMALAIWVVRGPARWWLFGVGLVLCWVFAPVTQFDVRGARVVSSDGQVALVIDRPSAERLLSGVRRAGLDEIDVVIMASSSRRARVALSSLQARHNVGLVVAATDLQGAVHLVEPTELRVGADVLLLEPRGAILDVEITAVAAG